MAPTTTSCSITSLARTPQKNFRVFLRRLPSSLPAPAAHTEGAGTHIYTPRLPSVPSNHNARWTPLQLSKHQSPTKDEFTSERPKWTQSHLPVWPHSITHPHSLCVCSTSTGDLTTQREPFPSPAC